MSSIPNTAFVFGKSVAPTPATRNGSFFGAASRSDSSFAVYSVRRYICSAGRGGFQPRVTDHSSKITATSRASSTGFRRTNANSAASASTAMLRIDVTIDTMR